MRVVLTTNDPVRLSFVRSLLADAGIGTVVLDTHAAVVDGSISAIQRRIVVDDADHARATRVLRDAGEL